MNIWLYCVHCLIGSLTLVVGFSAGEREMGGMASYPVRIQGHDQLGGGGGGEGTKNFFI